MKLYHYTSIETLACILESKQIRFNRLDRVDDLREAQVVDGIHFGKYLFASCWTHGSGESIPLWHMYTDDMRGVRIAAPEYPFQSRLLESPENHPFNLKSSGSIYGPIPPESMWTDKYCLLPAFLDRDKFGNNVDYVPDVGLLYRQAAENVSNSGGEAGGLSLAEPFDLARYKHAEWTFEQEYRFVLFILPSLPLPTTPEDAGQFRGKFTEHLVNCLLSGVGPDLEEFYVGLDESVLEGLDVTLGPKCTRGDRLIVEALLEKYAPEARLEESVLTGTVR